MGTTNQVVKFVVTHKLTTDFPCQNFPPHNINQQHYILYTYSVTVDRFTLNTPELAIAVRGSLAAAELVKYCRITCSVPCGNIFSVDFTLRPFFNSATGNYGDYKILMISRFINKTINNGYLLLLQQFIALHVHGLHF